MQFTLRLRRTMAQKIPSTASSHFRWCMLMIRGFDYGLLMIRGLDYCLLMIRGLDYCLPMICLRWLTCWRCPRSSQRRPRVSATCDPCRQQCQEDSEGTHKYCNVCCEIKAACDGGAGHEEVDDIDHTLFNSILKRSTSMMIMNMMVGSKPWADRWRWWGLCWWWTS